MNNEKKSKEDEEKSKVTKVIPFSCFRCGLREDCHYFGTNPDFCRKSIKFEENAFVMRDPFSPRVAGKPHFLFLGGICASCSAGEEIKSHQESPFQVCADCSIFYRQRFCLDCAAQNIRDFPQDVGTKIEKKIAQENESKKKSSK